MTGITREDVLRASCAWRWVPPGAVELQIAGISVIDYPDWTHLGFYAIPAKVDDPERAVAAVHNAARQRDHETVEWFISPSTSPASVEEALVARRAVLSRTLDILAIDLSAGLQRMPVTGATVTYVVDNAVRLDDAEQVAAAVWGSQPSSGGRRAEQLRSLGHTLHDGDGFRVVSYADGRAISTAKCKVVGDVAQLYGGATLPGFRGLGGYRASVAKRLEVARQAGARLAVVHAVVETSRSILTSLGFVAYGEARLYKVAAR